MPQSTSHKIRTSNKILIRLLSIIGGLLFTIFVGGFRDSLAEKQPVLVVCYTIAGFLGLILLFIGLVLEHMES